MLQDGIRHTSTNDGDMDRGSDSVGISNNEAKETEATSNPQSEKRAGESEGGGEATRWRPGVLDSRHTTYAFPLMLPPPKAHLSHTHLSRTNHGGLSSRAHCLDS